jgi:hypothetical protein
MNANGILVRKARKIDRSVGVSKSTPRHASIHRQPPHEPLCGMRTRAVAKLGAPKCIMDLNGRFFVFYLFSHILATLRMQKKKPNLKFFISPLGTAKKSVF